MSRATAVKPTNTLRRNRRGSHRSNRKRALVSPNMTLALGCENRPPDVLLSSTPEGYEGTHAFMGDITVNDESADVALHARTKEEHGSTATSNQVTYEYSAGS